MKLFLATTTALSLFALSACAEANTSKSAVNTTDRAQIESIIKSYLLENPEIIRDAMIALEEKQDRELIAAFQEELTGDSRDVSYGPADAKVTIVEFFDYNCSYCKRSTEWVRQTLEAHPNDVRVIFKELPILEGRTKTSRNAALAALAAGRQGQYKDMHFALMRESGLSEAKIEQLAQEIGLDVKKLRADMKDPKLAKQIEDTILLAQNLPPLTGTPFFVINDKYLAGANSDALQKLLDDALAG